jgi:hypothetical protein
VGQYGFARVSDAALARSRGALIQAHELRSSALSSIMDAIYPASQKFIDEQQCIANYSDNPLTDACRMLPGKEQMRLHRLGGRDWSTQDHLSWL